MPRARHKTRNRVPKQLAERIRAVARISPPLPWEIAAACEIVQENWTPEERAKRQVQTSPDWTALAVMFNQAGVATIYEPQSFERANAKD